MYTGARYYLIIFCPQQRTVENINSLLLLNENMFLIILERYSSQWLIKRLNVGWYVDIKSHNRGCIYIYMSATVHCFLSVSRVSIVRSICLLCFDDSVIFNYSREMKNSIIVWIGWTFQWYIFIGILTRVLVTWLVG